MPGARSHTDLICWRLAHELKLAVYALIDSGALRRHADLCDQLRRSAANAPRNIAEGFGRYLPRDFIRYLRFANGELKETFESLRDAHDRRCLPHEEMVRLQRLCKRASKASTNFIRYLQTATPPGAPPPRRRTPPPRDTAPKRTIRTEPPEPPEPPAPPEPQEPQEPQKPPAPPEPQEPPEPPEPPEPSEP